MLILAFLKYLIEIKISTYRNFCEVYFRHEVNIFQYLFSLFRVTIAIT